MRTLALTNALNWPAIVEEVERSKTPIALIFGGQVCGFVMPPHMADELMQHIEPTPASKVGRPPLTETVSHGTSIELPNYLDLLRSDPTQVPMVDGERLEFITMMNSAYVDPDQFFQFRHPRTHHIYIYRACELAEALGRSFSPVAFIPASPREYVSEKR